MVEGCAGAGEDGGGVAQSAGTLSSRVGRFHTKAPTKRYLTTRRAHQMAQSVA